MAQNDIMNTAIPVNRCGGDNCVDLCVAYEHQNLGYQGV